MIEKSKHLVNVSVISDPLHLFGIERTVNKGFGVHKNYF